MVFRGVVWGAAGSISGLDATCHPPPTTHHPPPIRHPPQLLGRWKEKLDADYSAAVQARAAWKESMLTRRIRMSVPDLTSASAHEGGVEREGGMTRPVSTGTLGVGAGGAVGVAGAADPFPPPPGGREGASSAGAAAAAVDGGSGVGGSGGGGGGGGGGVEGATPASSSHAFGPLEEPPPLPPKPPVMFMVHIGHDASQATSYVEVSPRPRHGRARDPGRDPASPSPPAPHQPTKIQHPTNPPTHQPTHQPPPQPRAPRSCAACCVRSRV